MVLTPEQKERIRVNRERAYQLKQERLRRQQQEECGDENGSGKKRGASSRTLDGVEGGGKDGNENIGSPCNEAKRPKTVSNVKSSDQEDDEQGAMRGTTINGKDTMGNNDEDQKAEEDKEKVDDTKEEEEDIILEEFEMNASKYVTKNEAKHMYCLPEGTLAICEYIEKENPHNKLWKPMKMYLRSDIRRRARLRYGGMDGLIKEREQRQQRQYNKDLQQTENIFSKKTKTKQQSKKQKGNI